MSAHLSEAQLFMNVIVVTIAIVITSVSIIELANVELAKVEHNTKHFLEAGQSRTGQSRNWPK